MILGFAGTQIGAWQSIDLRNSSNIGHILTNFSKSYWARCKNTLVLVISKLPTLGANHQFFTVKTKLTVSFGSMKAVFRFEHGFKLIFGSFYINYLLEIQICTIASNKFGDRRHLNETHGKQLLIQDYSLI